MTELTGLQLKRDSQYNSKARLRYEKHDYCGKRFKHQ